jgi:hypothetical protein
VSSSALEVPGLFYYNLSPGLYNREGRNSKRKEMTRSSTLSVSYKALISFMETQKSYAEMRYSKAKANGVTNLEALKHDVECASKLLKMLKKCEPGRQAGLFALFNESR